MSWSCCGLRWGVGRRVGCVGGEARKRVAASSKHIDGGEARGMRTRNTWRRWGELGSEGGYPRMYGYACDAQLPEMKLASIKPVQ